MKTRSLYQVGRQGGAGGAMTALSEARTSGDATSTCSAQILVVIALVTRSQHNVYV